MLLKRFAALLMALMLFVSGAVAENISATPIATYTLPIGAEALQLMDSDLWTPPEGLEQMYTLMQNADPYGHVYLIRMKNGNALVSVSCTTAVNDRTVHDLQQMWPQIAQSIANEGAAVDASESCATVQTLYGFEALSIDTSIWLENGTALDANGTAFYRGEELLEVWAVAPAEGSYAANETREAQLRSDRADMQAFLNSLNFKTGKADALNGFAFSDPDGRFITFAPEGCTVLTPHSTQEEIENARQAYVAAHPNGGEKLFAEYVKDVTEEQTVVFIAADQQSVAEIYASQLETFRDVTVEQLRSLSEPIRQSLAERFGIALLLSTSERAVISGYEHSFLTYWLRTDDVNVQLDVMAVVLEDAWLYEIDIYTHEGERDLRTLWHTYFEQSTVYTPLVNGLE